MNIIQTQAPAKLSKKQARKLIYSKLSAVLTKFKPEKSEKKFNGKLKKASKLFVVDILKSSAQMNKKKEKNEDLLLKAANE
ncbi:MAG: hypothetical protein ABIP79_17975 [Chitinophagaceae bacterium]